MTFRSHDETWVPDNASDGEVCTRVNAASLAILLAEDKTSSREVIQ